MTKRPLFLFIALAILLAGIAGAWGVIAQKQAEDARQAALATLPVITGDYLLSDHRGNQVDQDSYKGKYQLIYFGFSFCPDICPTSLLKMTNAYRALPPDIADKIIPIFVSVDPDRDSVAALNDYVSLFHNDLIGLVGDHENTAKIAKAFKVYYKSHRKTANNQNNNEAADDDYLVDHSSFYYLIGPQNRLVKLFGHDTSADQMEKAILEIVR